MDLIVEIEITRRNRGYDDYTSEKEAKFDCILILRRDGTIEAAEGCVGT